jgi:hypothetical protein
MRDNDVNLETNELCRDFSEFLRPSFGPSKFDREGSSFDPAKFA